MPIRCWQNKAIFSNDGTPPLRMWEKREREEEEEEEEDDDDDDDEVVVVVIEEELSISVLPNPIESKKSGGRARG